MQDVDDAVIANAVLSKARTSTYYPDFHLTEMIYSHSVKYVPIEISGAKDPFAQSRHYLLYRFHFSLIPMV